jgi:hypothetical protein
MNPKTLRGIEAQIWSSTYAAVYAQGRHEGTCATMADAAVRDFRKLYPTK